MRQKKVIVKNFKSLEEEKKGDEKVKINDRHEFRAKVMQGLRLNNKGIPDPPLAVEVEEDKECSMPSNTSETEDFPNHLDKSKSILDNLKVDR